MVYPQFHTRKKEMHSCDFEKRLCHPLTSYVLCNLVRLKMAAGKAHIGKLAPDFTAKAVMPDGQFKDLKLSDYRGTPQPVSQPLLSGGCFDDGSLLDCDSLLFDPTIC